MGKDTPAPEWTVASVLGGSWPWLSPLIMKVGQCLGTLCWLPSCISQAFSALPKQLGYQAAQ